ncbi:GIY-YIG nuclease family protein [Sphingomonas swuensis]|uniref:GIY-YIG nuclease family protein n=1 Tax=Sphingomonas swuensis TaxID=977800 RepID=A0ABP7SYY4_9SPHN
MQLHFWVYLLGCADGSYYVGHTDNLEKRLHEHQNGIHEGYTQKRRPVRLLWSEATGSREEALAFERRIKGWTRAKKEALIIGDWAAIKWLSKPPSERASTSLSTNEPCKIIANFRSS